MRMRSAIWLNTGRSGSIRGVSLPTTLIVRQDNRTGYEAWLTGEVLLFGLLSASLALFMTHSSLATSYTLPHLRLVLQTAIVLAGALVSLLAGARFSAEGRRTDLLLCLGFFVGALATAAFSIAPQVAERPLSPANAWINIRRAVSAYWRSPVI